MPLCSQTHPSMPHRGYLHHRVMRTQLERKVSWSSSDPSKHSLPFSPLPSHLLFFLPSPPLPLSSLLALSPLLLSSLSLPPFPVSSSPTPNSGTFLLRARRENGELEVSPTKCFLESIAFTDVLQILGLGLQRTWEIKSLFSQAVV